MGKGILIAVVLAALDISFLKSLTIAVVSAILTGIFAIIAATIAVRETRHTRERIHDVAAKIDADRRTGDPVQKMDGYSEKNKE